MTFQPSVQALLSSHITLAPTGSLCAVNWNKGWILAPGSNGGIARIQIVGGAELAHAGIPDWPSSSNAPIGLDPIGHVYLIDPTGNFCGIAQLDELSLAKTGQGGASSGSNNLPNGIATPNAIVGMNVGNFTYLIAPTLVGFDSGPHIQVLLQPTFWGHYFKMLNDGIINHWNPLSCPGPPGSNFFWTLLAPRSVAAPSFELTVFKTSITSLGPWMPSDWPTQNPGIVSAAQGSTVTPADVDAGWTEIYCAGVCLDHADGNLLAQVSGQGGATNPHYIIKINSTTGAVMWTVPVRSVDPNGQMMAYSRIQFSQYGYIDQGSGPGHFVFINTITGVATTYTTNMGGLTLEAGQAYDDTLGCVISEGIFLAGSGAPTPIAPNTPNSFTGWMAFFPGDAPFINKRQYSGGKKSYVQLVRFRK